MAKSRSGDAEVGSDEKTQGKTTKMMSDGKPDGGCLAWTIVAASFMVSFLQDGFRFVMIFPLSKRGIVNNIKILPNLLLQCCHKDDTVFS